MMINKKYEVKQSGELRTLDLYLYGEIQSDYYDFWTGETVESTTSAKYVREAFDEAENIDKINIYINSCGGSVSEGIAIYNILKRSSAFKTVYVDAFAYSIASVIAMAGDKIIMPSNTTMMIHNAMMAAYGNETELRKAADDLAVINEASCNTYLIKAGDKIDKETLKQLLDAETFLSAEDAFNYGFIDEIANPIDLSNSVEVIEQAKKKHNPSAKSAFEFVTAEKQRQVKERESQPPMSSEDKFDWLKNLIYK